MEDRCEFCASLNVISFRHKIGRIDHPGLCHDVSVAIVERTWTKEDGRRNASRRIMYSTRELGYKLNFCPECGKRIKKPGRTKKGVCDE